MGVPMSDHRIERMRVHQVRIPARAVHSHGIGDVSGIAVAILEIATDTGLTGWGEASPWPAFSGSTLEGCAAALHGHIRPLLEGQDPLLVERHWHAVDRALAGHPEAKAAVEMALLDIAGQAAGLPVCELLGGRMRDEMGLSFSVANPDFGKDLEDVARLWADGVRIFKVKTGFAEHAFDMMRLGKLREIYGDELDLRVDYNQGLEAHDAIRRVRELEQFRPTFVEQPVKARERDAMARIADAVDVTLMADESVFDAVDALDAVRRRLADAFSLKVMKSGGIRRALEVAAIARAAGIGVYGGCMFETGLAHAAGAHLMAAVPGPILECEFYMATYYATEDILTEPFPVTSGRVRVPQGPGLGVSVDPEALRRHALGEPLG